MGFSLTAGISDVQDDGRGAGTSGNRATGGAPGACSGCIKTDKVCRFEREANVEVRPRSLENVASRQNLRFYDYIRKEKSKQHPLITNL